MARYNRTGRVSEAFVNVRFWVDEGGIPICAIAEEVVGDSTLAHIAVGATLLSKWTIARSSGRPVEHSSLIRH